MKHRKTLWKSCVLILCLCAGYMLQHGRVSFQPRKADASVVPAGKAAVSFAKLPLSFEANQGQTDARVKFLSRGPGYTLFLTGDEVTLELQKPGVRSQESGAGHIRSALQRTTGYGERTTNHVLRLKLVNANRNAAVVGESALPGKSNYFIGNDPDKWRTNVPTYAKVKYEGVYPGVDLVFYGNQRQLEHDFVVAPGGDASRIALRLGGSKKVSLDAEGNLAIAVEGGEVRLQRPLVYQEDSGGRREVPGGYILRGAREVAFKVGAYDPTEPLVIDPVLEYSTYLGGSRSDFGVSIAVDSSGNAYVAGYTESSNFPTTAGAFQTSLTASAGNGFVTKLNSSGSALVYSTYLGGNNGDGAFGIAVDLSGNAYVTGYTGSSDFPTTPGAFQTTLASSSTNGFVTKLNPTGSALVYSTYLGGNADDFAIGIVVDSSGDVYVTGVAYSGNFPTTAGAFQTSFAATAGNSNAFVTKLNRTGSALVYSTYLGGTGSDHGDGMAVDSLGNAYVSGFAQSANFPTTAGAFQTALAGSQNAFVTELNPGGSALLYSTYLGGSSSDYAVCLAVDSSGNAYVSGFARSANFPTTAGAFQTALAGSQNAFVTELNPGGSALVYSTYFGGSDEDQGYGIAVDSLGNAYVTGYTASSNFPATEGAFQTSLAGGQNAFVAKFENTLEAQIVNLQNTVKGLVSTGTLSAGSGQLLLRPLIAALAAVNAGRTAVAVRDLDAFIRDIRLLVILRRLTPTEGQTLINAANRLIAELRG
ncbi:MAG: SBBP repeat-containing protein [Terriglobia bacterium]